MYVCLTVVCRGLRQPFHHLIVVVMKMLLSVKLS